MPNTGNLFPGTAESVARGAGTAWPTPSNVLSDDTTDSICASGGSGSQYLVCRNFGLSLATGDTVGGITIRVEASEHSGGTEVLNAQLQDNTGALIGTAKTVTLSGVAKAIYTYGSTTDLWGATLTETIVNNANFGVRLWFTTTHDVRIDFVTAAVEYVLATVPGEGGPFPPEIFPPEIFPGPIFPGLGGGEDVTAALPGVAASSTTGIILPSTRKTLPGVQISAAVGFINPEGDELAVLSGVSTNVAVGSVSLASSRPITGVASTIAVGITTRSEVISLELTGVRATVGTGYGGNASWGTSWGGSWGETWGVSSGSFDNGIGILLPRTQLAATGAQANASVSNLVESRIQSLSGVGVNAQSGFVTAGQDKVANLTGVDATATAGAVIAPIVGVNVAVSTGSLVSSRTRALTSAAATAAAGILAADKERALLGVSANATVGTLIFNRTPVLTGVALTGTASTLPPIQHLAFPQTPPATVAVGLLVQTKTISLSGVQTNATAGNLTITIVGLTGVEANAIAGFVTAGADRVANLIGVAVTAQAGTVTLGATGLLIGVPAVATVGTVIAQDRSIALSGVQTNATAGTITAVPDRQQALTGVQIYGQGWYVTTGNDIVVLALTSTVSSVAGAILEVQRISTLGGSGVAVDATIGSPGTTPNREQALTGVAVSVAAGLIQRESVTLTGVGVNAAAGNVDNTVQKTLPAVTATAAAGFMPPAGDKIVELIGVDVIAEAGVLGVIPAIPISNYRHIAPGPIRNRRIKDLEELEREMALMEE